MGNLRKLRAHLTYANVMASVAVFIALGGGAYAVSLPRNSVGTQQLKKRAVTAKKLSRNAISSVNVKNFSLRTNDFRRGELPGLLGARSNDAEPPAAGPRATTTETTLKTTAPGSLFVFATLRDSFLSCSATGPCSASWGIYVDDKPVPDSGLVLSAPAAAGDGHSFDTLFGLSSELKAGAHTVKLQHVDSGSIESIGQLGVQLGALSAG